MNKLNFTVAIFFFIISLSFSFASEPAKAQAILDNTIYERLWMAPVHAPQSRIGILNVGIDMDFDSAGQVHVVMTVANSVTLGHISLVYLFRLSNNWYYIVLDEVAHPERVGEPKIGISEDDTIHVTYVGDDAVKYLTIDTDKNITRHPHIPGIDSGTSMLLSEQGYPVVAYKIPVVNSRSRSFVVSEFNGDVWVNDTLSVETSRGLGGGYSMPFTRLFRDADGRNNVIIHKDFDSRTEFVWNRKEGDNWVIVDRSPSQLLWGNNQFWGIDVTTDSDGNLHACYGSTLQFRYLWTENDQLFHELIKPGSNNANCRITIDENEAPVVFAYSVGGNGLHVSKKTGNGWNVTSLASDAVPLSTPVSAKTDASGDIHLLLFVLGGIAYTTGSDLQDGIFTGLKSSAVEETVFNDVISANSEIFAFFTETAPETHVNDQNRLETTYYPVSDILLRSDGASGFSRHVTDREPGDRRTNKYVAYGNGHFVKLNHSEFSFMDTGDHRIWTYQSHLYRSENGIDWTEYHSLNSLRGLGRKLTYALDRFWLLDAGGYYTSADGTEWESHGPILDIFDPTDFIVFGGALTYDDRFFVLVHNQGRVDNSDASCLLCPTSRSGKYMLIYSENTGWTMEQLGVGLERLAFRGFLVDDAGLINVGIGATRRSEDGLTWTSEVNNLEREPGQVVKSGDFYFMVDRPMYNWTNRQMNGYLRISRDGLTWREVPFNDRYVSDAKYRLAATEEQLFVINLAEGIILEWGESEGQYSDDARLLSYDQFNRDPEEDLYIAGKWQSVPGNLSFSSTPNLVTSNYPDLYGLFVNSNVRLNNVQQPGVIQFWDGREWVIITRLDRVFYRPYVFHDGQRTRLISYSHRRATTGDRDRRLESWDGETWTVISDNDFNMGAITMTTWNHDGIPKLVVSGNGFPAAEKFLAIWDGSDWIYFSGQSYESRLPAGAITTANHGGVEYLYAAGNLMSIDGVPVQRIARYDGSNWEPVSGGVNGEPTQMVTMRSASGENDTIVLSGLFDGIIGDTELPVSGMAAYDGDSWKKIEPELDGTQIRSLLVYYTIQGPILFAGGTPQLDPNGVLNSIGAWDGEHWYQLDNGVQFGYGQISDIAIFNDSEGPYLYTIGSFNRAGDIAVSSFARIPLYDKGRRISSQVVNLTDGESQLIPLPDAGLTLMGDVINAGWMSVSLFTETPDFAGLPEHLLGAANLMWQFETESVDMNNIFLSTEIPDAEELFGEILGKYAPESLSGIDDAMVWLMEGDEGWTDLGGVISNNHLVSVSPSNTLSRAAIGLLREPTLVNLDEDALPLEFSLGQNYPNPFNPSTTIRYRLPEASNVRLDIYDIIGRRVASLVNEQLAAGEHTAVFDGSRLASGVYLYRLQAGNRTMVRKMLLVK